MIKQTIFTYSCCGFSGLQLFSIVNLKRNTKRGCIISICITYFTNEKKKNVKQMHLEDFCTAACKEKADWCERSGNWYHLRNQCCHSVKFILQPGLRNYEKDYLCSPNSFNDSLGLKTPQH